MAHIEESRVSGEIVVALNAEDVKMLLPRVSDTLTFMEANLSKFPKFKERIERYRMLLSTLMVYIDYYHGKGKDI